MSTIAALVVKVQADVSDIQRNVEQVHSTLSELGHGAMELGQILGEAFAVRQVAEFVLAIGESAKTLRNLSRETGIGVESLQILATATKDYGVDAEQLGRAIFQLGKRIAGGDDSAATALHMMGLRVDEMRAKDPESLFRAIRARARSRTV